MKTIIGVLLGLTVFLSGCTGAKLATPPSQNISTNETISPNATTSLNIWQNAAGSPNVSANVIWTDTTSLPLAPENVLYITGFAFGAASYLRFSGNTSLPDGSILSSQLYDDGKPCLWWPVNQPIEVKYGQWQVSTLLGANGAPSTMVVGHDYLLIVYSDSIKAEHHFFVDEGPPANITPDPINVVSVSSGGPINPGGPIVEITLKNVSLQPIVSLNATLDLSGHRPFVFTFPTPVLQGATAIAKLILIGGGYSSENSYPLTINGTMQDGHNFSFTTKVKM